MEASFKNLPLYLYSFSSQKNEDCVLWLPPIDKHRVTKSIDWLCGLQISNMTYKKDPVWPLAIKQQIVKYDLPLNETHPDFNSNFLFFSLPPGFKASLGIIKKDCSWSSADTVIREYRAATEHFKKQPLVQSLNIWNSPSPQGFVEWIEI